LRKKKFPEINYSFMEKSTYRRKKKNTFLKVIVGLVLTVLAVYIGLYLFDRFGDFDIGDIFKKKENELIQEEVQETPVVTEVKEEEEQEEEQEPIEEKVEEPPAPKILPREMIALQASFFGIGNNDYEAKAKEFKEITGEDFNTAFMFNSDKELIPDEIIKDLSRDEASILRNEIYARHGYAFGQGRLASYFNLKTWYTSKTRAVELNEIEKQNVTNIYAYERSKGWK